MSEVIYMLKLRKTGKVVASIIGTIIVVALIITAFVMMGADIRNAIFNVVSNILVYALCIILLLFALCCILSSFMVIVYCKPGHITWKEVYKEEKVQEYLDEYVKPEMLEGYINISPNFFTEDIVKRMLHDYVDTSNISCVFERNKVTSEHESAVVTLINKFRKDTGFIKLYI